MFDKNGVYLPMKKVGKNNPKTVQVKADNEVGAMWNQMVDRALVSGVPEVQIMDVKQSEIGRKASASIQKSGRNPAMFKSLIMTAIYALEQKLSRSEGNIQRQGAETVAGTNGAVTDADRKYEALSADHSAGLWV